MKKVFLTFTFVILIISTFFIAQVRGTPEETLNVCGNNICEEGEANTCPPCTSADPNDGS